MSRREVLNSIRSPGGHRHEMFTEEFTFEGEVGQPDFADLRITMQIGAGKRAPELKSVKKYLYSFRSRRMSYERAVDTIWEDFQAVYRPEKLHVEISTNFRGGIASKVWTGELPE